MSWWTEFLNEWLPSFADAATAIGGIAIVFALVPFFQSRKQRLRDAEQWYVGRYWAIQDRIAVGDVEGRLKKLPTEKDIYDELRLCEDELDSRRNGFITNPTWAIWSNSIRSIANDASKRTLLDRVDEMVLLRAYLDDGIDPIGIGRVRAYLRGLH